MTLQRPIFALIFVSLLSPLAWAQAETSGFDQSHKDFTSLLKERVTSTSPNSSTVDYKGLQKNSFLLNKYLKMVSRVKIWEFESYSQSNQLAFLINAYNAFTLKLITDNYPVASIKKIGGLFKNPWKIKFINLFGRTLSLDDIEHEWLRKKYSEPRIHFAINCASIGCPALRDEAYEGDKLETQLEVQARMFLSDSSRNLLDTENKTLKLSPIFKWFKEDFEKVGSVQKFVAKYMTDDPPAQLAIEKFNIQYTDYDWDLNKTK